MPGIGIISNPNSKKNRKKPKRHQYLSYIAGEDSYSAITYSLQELTQVAKDFKQRNIKILAINGGDGTLSQTLTAFIDVYGDEALPKIVPLRGGTINFVAENLGIKGSPEQILFRLIESYSQPNKTLRSKFVKSIEVEGQHGFLFANGTCAYFLELFYQNKTGPLGSALLLLKILASRLFNKSYFSRVVRTQKTSLQIDEQSLDEHESLSVLIASFNRMPLGLKLFPSAGQNDFEAQLVSYTAKPLEAAYKVPFDLIIRPGHTSNVKITACGQRFKVATKTPTPYTLDGELFYPEKKGLEVKTGKTLEFIIV